MNGQAVRTVEEIRSQKDLAPIWEVSQEKLHELWAAHDPDRAGVVTADKAASLVGHILDTQREALTGVISQQRHTKDDLLQGVNAWLPRWKRWGVSLEVRDQEDRIALAERLLAKLQDPALKATILKALHPDAAGNITHFNFMEALVAHAHSAEGSKLKAAELDVLAAKAQGEDASNALAEAAEPLIVAEAKAAMQAAETAKDAAHAAAHAAHVAAAAEKQAMELARAAQGQADEIKQKLHGDTATTEAAAQQEIATAVAAAVAPREETTEAGSEELDFMDLLASLDLIDYASVLYVRCFGWLADWFPLFGRPSLPASS